MTDREENRINQFLSDTDFNTDSSFLRMILTMTQLFYQEVIETQIQVQVQAQV